jgi:hypothetical protein
MTDRIGPPNGPGQRPWPEVTDLSRIYDHGHPWCVNADAHPDRHDGYPDPDRHQPWKECRSREAFIDDVRRDLHGDELGLSVYLAAPFRFGAPRDGSKPQAPRLVVETWLADSDERSERISLNPSGALWLARILVRFVDELTFLRRAA